ncbi:MAG TPA: hypothetical protein VGH89_23710 [Pseudonocardia sp.]
MSDASTREAVQAAGGPIEEIVATFMLHPETFDQSTASGYPHPFAGYFAGRGGVLGEADANAVSAVFAFFEPNVVKMFWEQGLPVHGAAGGAKLYSEQVAGFARKYLKDAEGMDRLAALGEKVADAAGDLALPLFAGWRRMPLADDAPARALQLMFVLRELRFGIHASAVALSGLTPVEAHMLNRGAEYCAFFGWSEPFASGEDKKDRYEAAEESTNQRMTEIVAAALNPEEAAELARLADAALQTVKAATPPTEGGPR